MNKAYQVVKDFEDAIAEYTNAPYAVSVESCSAAIFLCCKLLHVELYNEIKVPKYTYPSVPASIVNAGGRVRFIDFNWQANGVYYQLDPMPVIDAAKLLKRNMYNDFQNMYVCLSFHGKKRLQIGRGGMILCSDNDSVNWFKTARFDGRHECSLTEDTLTMPGWNFYMTPQQAARGLELLQWYGDGTVDQVDTYQDLSRYDFFTKANR